MINQTRGEKRVAAASAFSKLLPEQGLRRRERLASSRPLKGLLGVCVHYPKVFSGPAIRPKRIALSTRWLGAEPSAFFCHNQISKEPASACRSRTLPPVT